MYRMAGYCRLSKEDGENRISESIENQIRLISEYVEKIFQDLGVSILKQGIILSVCFRHLASVMLRF